jgi:alpha-L-fucosidase
MGLPGVDWETCMTMNDHWGYNSHDDNWKTSEQLIRTLVDVASKGGNLLLNVGPTAEGLIPQPSVERLAAMGAWLKVNGESIYGTTASPFPALSWGRATVKRSADGTTRLYLHVFEWPKNGRLAVAGLLNDARAAFLIADTTRTHLATGRDADALTIAVPAAAPDPIDSVIAVDLAGAPDVGLAPVITAPNPIFVDSLEVSVTTGQQNVELRYTTNGTNPAATSPLVTGPIRLAATAQVSARAFRNGRAVSPIARESFSKVLPQRSVALDTSTEPGVRYEYYEGKFEKTSDFKTPVGRGVVHAFDLKPRTRDAQFGFRYEGYLKVAAVGVYQFSTTSDDGSRLLIDGTVVVDNDGLHGSREKTGVIALDKGWHRIRVDFFQGDGDLDLKVHWSGPGVPRQPITERDLAFVMGNVRFK